MITETGLALVNQTTQQDKIQDRVFVHHAWRVSRSFKENFWYPVCGIQGTNLQMEKLEISLYTWGSAAGSLAEREREGAREREPASKHLDFFLYPDQGREPRVSWAHSLLVNLKHKSGNLKRGKRKKKQMARMVSYQNPPRFLKRKEPQWGEAAWLFIWWRGWQCVYSRYPR